MSKKVATLTVEVFLDGDYLHTTEVVDHLGQWIDSGLDDRDDVVGWTIEGYVEERDWDD